MMLLRRLNKALYVLVMGSRATHRFNKAMSLTRRQKYTQALSLLKDLNESKRKLPFIFVLEMTLLVCLGKYYEFFDNLDDCISSIEKTEIISEMDKKYFFHILNWVSQMSAIRIGHSDKIFSERFSGEMLDDLDIWSVKKPFLRSFPLTVHPDWSRISASL